MTKKLLLIDGSATIQKVVSISFATTEIEVAAAASGQDALSLASAERPDVIAIDTVGNAGAGYDLCAQLRADPMLSGTPVLLMTGVSAPLDEVRMAQCGAQDWIQKPFETQLLIEKVCVLAGVEVPPPLPGVIFRRPQGMAAPTPKPAAAAGPAPVMPPPAPPAVPAAEVRPPSNPPSMPMRPPAAPMAGQRPMQPGMPQRPPMAPMAGQRPMQPGMPQRPPMAPMAGQRPMQPGMRPPMAPMAGQRPMQPGMRPPMAPMAGQRPMQPGMRPPMAPMAGQRPMQPGMPQQRPFIPADPRAQEQMLRAMMQEISRDIIEKVVWEVVPQLAETMIREEMERLIQSRGGM